MADRNAASSLNEIRRNSGGRAASVVFDIDEYASAVHNRTGQDVAVQVMGTVPASRPLGPRQHHRPEPAGSDVGQSRQAAKL